MSAYHSPSTSAPDRADHVSVDSVRTRLARGRLQPRYREIRMTVAPTQRLDHVRVRQAGEFPLLLGVYFQSCFDSRAITSIYLLLALQHRLHLSLSHLITASAAKTTPRP